MRQTIRSPLYLTATIGYCCTIVFSLASTFRSGMAAVTNTAVYSLMGSSYGTSSWMGELNNWLPLVYGSSVGAALLGQLPGILVAIGLWMLYVSASDTSGAPLKTAGLSLIRGVQIFQLVMLGLMVLLLILSFFVMMAATGFYDMTSVIPVVLLFLVLVAVILGLVGFYYARLIATINGFRGPSGQARPRPGLPLCGGDQRAGRCAASLPGAAGGGLRLAGQHRRRRGGHCLCHSAVPLP